MAGPCPQAAASAGLAPPGPDPLLFAVEAMPPDPRPSEEWDSAAITAGPDPANVWPFHLPAWNAIDALWWAMLMRACYSPTDVFLRRTVEWASPIVRLSYTPSAPPPVIGHALVELPDQWLCIAPGFTDDPHRLQYIYTHAIDQTTVDPVAGWTANATWYQYAQTLWAAARAWVYPPAKPLLCVGHSSGGAITGVMSFLRVQAAPEVHVAAVQFGTVRWGTASLLTSKTLQKTPQIMEFANANDPFVALPPPFSVYSAFPLVRLFWPYPEYIRFGTLMDLVGGHGIWAHDQDTQTTLYNVYLGLQRGDLPNAYHHEGVYTRLASAWAINYAAANGLADVLRPLLLILADMDAADL